MSGFFAEERFDLFDGLACAFEGVLEVELWGKALQDDVELCGRELFDEVRGGQLGVEVGKIHLKRRPFVPNGPNHLIHVHFDQLATLLHLTRLVLHVAITNHDQKVRIRARSDNFRQILCFDLVVLLT